MPTMELAGSEVERECWVHAEEMPGLTQEMMVGREGGDGGPGCGISQERWKRPAARKRRRRLTWVRCTRR